MASLGKVSRSAPNILVCQALAVGPISKFKSFLVKQMLTRLFLWVF